MMITFKDYVAEKEKYYADMIKEKNLFKNRKFVIVQVGSVEASNRYVKNKLKDCEKIGLPAELKHFSEDISQAEFLLELEKLNNDKSVSSYIVQLPLPKHIDEAIVKKTIIPNKDADGFSPEHIADAATPKGIINWLIDNNHNLSSKLAIVIGRSNIVGKPLVDLLRKQDMTVINMHSKTTEEQKQELIPLADLIVVATGHRHTLTNQYKYKPTAIIIDCGINFDENGKICGDCDRDLPVAKQSQVPGSVGLTTRLQLMVNAITLEQLYIKRTS